jgi:hypothetical protein
VSLYQSEVRLTMMMSKNEHQREMSPTMTNQSADWKQRVD